MKTTQRHLEVLFGSLLRPGMFIGLSITKDLFITYLYGFRAGSYTNYFNELKEQLINKYDIKARGFVEQIETLSEENKLDWISNFAKESFELIL